MKKFCCRWDPHWENAENDIQPLSIAGFVVEGLHEDVELETELGGGLGETFDIFALCVVVGKHLVVTEDRPEIDPEADQRREEEN